MGKQKLTNEQVELIKHLIQTKIFTQTEVASYFGVQRSAVTKIKKGIRWSEVETPDEIRGKYLWYKLLNNKIK
jgi:transcriptional regulator with XRE-family HTH domain